MWAAAKAKAWGIGGAILGLLALLVRLRWVTHQRDLARKKARQATARADQAEATLKADTEIDQEYSDLRRESEHAIETGKMPDNIRDRNRY